MARPEKIRLGDLLVQQDIITNEQLKFALDEQKRSGRKLGRVLVESGYATEGGISRALARQLGADYVDLKVFQPQPELVKLLPEAQARRFRALVLDERNGQLRVGMSDPTDLAAFDEVARIVKRDIDLAVVTEGAVAAAARPRLSPHRGNLGPGQGPDAGDRATSRSSLARGSPSHRAPRMRRWYACCRRCSRKRKKRAPPTSISSRRKNR